MKDKLCQCRVSVCTKGQTALEENNKYKFDRVTVKLAVLSYLIPSHHRMAPNPFKIYTLLNPQLYRLSYNFSLFLKHIFFC